MEWDSNDINRVEELYEKKKQFEMDEHVLRLMKESKLRQIKIERESEAKEKQIEVDNQIAQEMKEYELEKLRQERTINKLKFEQEQEEIRNESMSVETPGDISGVVYIKMDDTGAWKMELAKEMKNCGLQVDMNKFCS